MQRATLLAITCGCLLAGGTARAQTSRPDAALPVYIDVRASASDSASMATFATKLLELAVADVPGVQVKSDQTSPCTAFSVPNRAAQSAPRPRVAALGEPDGSKFAVIRMILEEHRADAQGSSPDWLIDYNVIEGEWRNGRPVCPDASPLQRTQRVSQARLLDALNLSGDLVASTLVARAMPNRVNVQILVTPGRAVSQDIADELSAFLASRVAAMPEFRAFQRDSPTPSLDYVLDVAVRFSTNPRDPKGEVAGSLTLRDVKTTRTTTVPLASAPANTLPGFFRQVADAAVQRLYAARVAADLRLDRPSLEGTSSARLVNEARALLCIDAAAVAVATCKVQAEAALAVLAQLPPDSAPDARSLLGRAQSAAGRYGESARSFDQVVGSPAASRDQKLDAILRAGDAYASAKEYDKAAARYGTWLAQLDPAKAADPQALDVTIKQAQTLRIGRSVGDAIDTLMTAATRWPGSARVDQELGRLVPDLNKVQLANLLTRLAALQPREQLTTVRMRASRRLASEYLREGAFAEAEQTLTAVIDKDDTAQINADLASLYERWSGAPNLTEARRTELMRKGVEAVLPAVQRGIKEAYAQLARLNHALGEDTKSREVLEALIPSGKADPDSLLQLMYVCNEYVFDFDCSNRAADALDRIVPGHDLAVRQANILEVKVVHGDLAAANALKNNLLGDPSRMGGFRPIIFFYAAWINLAMEDRAAAADMVSEWKREMASIRSGRVDLDWVFSGAKRMLTTRPTLPPQDVAFVLSMITAMESETAPLPTFTRD